MKEKSREQWRCNICKGFK